MLEGTDLAAPFGKKRVGPSYDRVVPPGGEKKICLLEKDGCNGSRIDFVTTEVEESSCKVEEHVKKRDFPFFLAFLARGRS